MRPREAGCIPCAGSIMLSLSIGVAVLSLGPVLHRVALRMPFTLPVLDGFIFVAIGGLVLQHSVMESFHLAGWPVVPVALLGFVGPTIGEKVLHRAAHHVHRAALTLAMAGLAFHAALDGLALARSATPEAGITALALAVILHRIPVSLTIWVLLRPPYGVAAALATLGLVGLSTVAGFFAGGPLLGDSPGPGVGLFQALVAGSLLHVVVHRSPLQSGHGAWRLPEGLGALAGAVLLWTIMAVAPHEDHDHHNAGEHWEMVLNYGIPLGLAIVAVCLPRSRHDHHNS